MFYAPLLFCNVVWQCYVLWLLHLHDWQLTLEHPSRSLTTWSFGCCEIITCLSLYRLTLKAKFVCILMTPPSSWWLFFYVASFALLHILCCNNWKHRWVTVCNRLLNMVYQPVVANTLLFAVLCCGGCSVDKQAGDKGWLFKKAEPGQPGGSSRDEDED